MRHRATPRARGCAAATSLAFAVQLAISPASARAGALEPSDFEQLIADADGHADAGEDAEALDAYASAFEAMPDELKSSEIGEFVVLGAAKSALSDFAEHDDPAALERARRVLSEFIDLASGTAQSIEAAEARLAEVEDAIPPPVETPVDLPEPSPPPPAEPEGRGVPLGLLVGGGVAVLAGVSVIVAGVRQVPWYEQQLAQIGWVTTDPGYDEQIAAAERVRNIDLGLGIGLAVVGAGLAVGGGVLLARSKTGTETRASLTPRFHRHGGGLHLRLVF